MNLPCPFKPPIVWISHSHFLERIVTIAERVYTFKGQAHTVAHAQIYQKIIPVKLTYKIH